MWSSSGDSVGHLRDQEVAQRLAEKSLELLVESADAAHIVLLGRRHVRADVCADMFEVPRVLEDRGPRTRIFPEPRLQQVEGKLRMDDLLGGDRLGAI